MNKIGILALAFVALLACSMNTARADDNAPAGDQIAQAIPPSVDNNTQQPAPKPADPLTEARRLKDEGDTKLASIVEKYRARNVKLDSVLTKLEADTAEQDAIIADEEARIAQEKVELEVFIAAEDVKVAERTAKIKAAYAETEKKQNEVLEALNRVSAEADSDLESLGGLSGAESTTDKTEATSAPETQEKKE